MGVHFFGGVAHKRVDNSAHIREHTPHTAPVALPRSPGRQGMQMDSHPFAGIEDIAAEVMARQRARTAAQAAWYAANRQQPEPVSVETLRAELAQARAEFDPAYVYSDDYTEFRKHSRLEDRIAGLTARIAVMETAAQSLDDRMGQPMAALAGLTVRGAA